MKGNFFMLVLEVLSIRKVRKSKKGIESKKRQQHGMSKTRLYASYHAMKKRCYNNNDKRYHRYGGRGITVCAEWLDKKNGFINFYNWAMANGYQDDLTIDRINNDGNYEPSNCR